MNELTIGGKVYVSSKRAAEITGYAKDYVGQLCREGYVEATMVGRSWYALETSILEHRFGKEEIVAKKVLPALEQEVVEVSAPFIPAVEVVIDSPIYTTEDNLDMPIFNKSVVKEEYLVLVNPEPVSTIADMQGAWQEWFSKNKEPLIESPDIIEKRYEDEAQEDLLMPLVPIHENHEITPVAVFDEIPVRINKEFAPISPVQNTVSLTEAINVVDSIIIHKIASKTVRTSFPTIAHYKDETVSPKLHSSNAVLRSLLIGTALIFVAIALIGSGLAEKYITSSYVQGNSIISAIEGKTVIVK